ncbi:hypothetical protein GQ457_05G010960 [Hibiscus cannabinus]
MPGDLKSFLWWWNSQPIALACKPVWNMVFFGIVWTIWLCRNEVIFNSKCFIEELIFELSLVRIGYWCKSKWPNEFESISDFIRQPNLFGTIRERVRRPPLGSWSFSPLGILKFNVDASVNGSFGVVGIGGIIRNYYGTTLLKFSVAIGFFDSTAVELQAILKACRLWDLSEWKHKFATIIETDCQLAVRWITNDCQCPGVFADLVEQCRHLLDALGLQLSFVHRESNVAAHVLAKQAVLQDPVSLFGSRRSE